MVNEQLLLLNNILPILFVKIEKGVGSFLTFTSKDERETLWIYLSDWVIYKNKKKILDCENENNIVFLNVLYQIKSKPLVEIKNNTVSKTISFVFIGGYELHVYSNTKVYNIEDDLFIFFIKNKTISYSISQGFYTECRNK